MTHAPAFPLPITIDWPRAEGLIDEAALQWWWIAALLESGERRLGALFFLIRAGSETVEFKAVLTDLDSGLEATRRDEFPNSDVSFATGRVDIAAPGVSLEGSYDDGYIAKVRFDDGADYALSMRPVNPVMFNCSTGEFSGWGSTSKQYALGGMDTSGVVHLGGERLEVTGASWYDRQWSGENAAVVSPRGPFIWMGIWLENGDTISLWDQIPATVDPAEKSWATVLRPDGTYIVMPLPPFETGAAGRLKTPLGNEVPRSWTLRLPGANMTLQITQTALQEDAHRGFFTGALDVVATCAGAEVSGRGVAELVRWHG